MKKISFLLLCFILLATHAAATKLTSTGFESDFKASNPALFSIVPTDPTVNHLQWTLTTAFTTEGLKATYNYNPGGLIGTFGLFDIVFSSPINLQEDASLMLSSISVHNNKSANTAFLGGSTVTNIQIEAYDQDDVLLTNKFSTTAYSPRPLYTNKPWNSYGNFFLTGDLSKLSKVKKLSFKIIFANNLWGAGSLTIPYLKIGKAPDDTQMTHLDYDFTQQIDRDNLFVAFKNEQYSSSNIDVNQTDGQALYLKNTNRENAEFFSIILPQPLKLDYNLSYTLLSKIINNGTAIAQKDYTIMLVDGKNRSYTINTTRVLTNEVFDWTDKVIPTADLTKIDFGNIRRIQIQSLNKTDETWAVKSLLIGNIGEEPEITPSLFKYDFNGNKLYSPNYQFSNKDGDKNLSRLVPGYLNVAMPNASQWNSVYFSNTLTQSIDMSLSKTIKMVIESDLNYENKEPKVEFLLKDEAGKEAQVDLETPDGELIIDFSATGGTDFDWSKVKTFIMRSTTWGNNATGSFKLKYLEMGYTKPVSLQHQDAICFNLYPNPTSDLLVVDTEAQNFELSIVDSSGKIVLQQKNSTQINMQSFPQGIYLIKISTPATTLHHKVVKR